MTTVSLLIVVVILAWAFWPVLSIDSSKIDNELERHRLTSRQQARLRHAIVRSMFQKVAARVIVGCFFVALLVGLTTSS